MESLRTAVVGVGHLGNHHARLHSQAKGARLVAVCDPDPKAGNSVAKKLGVEWVEDYRDLVDRVDAVSVAVPTIYHHEVSTFFLDRGVHVLVEKPIASNLEQARDMNDRARKGDLRLAVGHVERFNPAVSSIRDLKLDPRFIESHRISPFSFRSVDVGVVLDLMIHDIDIILSLVSSPVSRIDAHGVGVLGECEDIANARIQFENGCVANATASRISIKSMRKIRVFSENCYVSLDCQNFEGHIYKKSPDLSLDEINVQKMSKSSLMGLRELGLFGKLVEIKKIKPQRGANPLALEIQDFLDSIREGRDPIVPGEHGIRALEVATGILERIEDVMRAQGRIADGTLDSKAPDS
ncbi:MAG: Gfo/Idh/MocA family oxidoreductase [Planctomycetota bacterium]|jgi:predicted dehydrogenase|nr:Gfo/Idh/MocA family oxidoreductase [Planctomycetota bacterium]